MIVKTLKCIASASILSAALALPAAAQTSCGVVVFYSSGQTGPSAEALAVLRDFVARNQGAPLSVVGYADAPGDAAVNLALTQSRAQEVAAALGGANIVQVAGGGEAVRPGTTGPNDPANRRVEVTNQNCVGAVVTRAPTGLGPGFAAAAGVGVLAIAAASVDGGSSGGSSGSTGGTGSSAASR